LGIGWIDRDTGFAVLGVFPAHGSWDHVDEQKPRTTTVLSETGTLSMVAAWRLCIVPRKINRAFCANSSGRKRAIVTTSFYRQQL
jgi:hypothetical protein